MEQLAFDFDGTGKLEPIQRWLRVFADMQPEEKAATARPPGNAVTGTRRTGREVADKTVCQRIAGVSP